MTNEGPRRLRRNHDRKIAGVAAGVADYLDLDPTLVRLAFVVIAFVGLGGAVIAYAVMWLVMPAPAGEGASAPPPAPQSKLLLALLAVLLALSLAGGIASLGMLSFSLMRISLPIWLIVIIGAYLLLRSRPSRTS